MRINWKIMGAITMLAFMVALGGCQRSRSMPVEPTAISPSPAYKAAIPELQNAELGPKKRGEWTFAPGPFPELAWRNPAVLEPILGQNPLRVRWFDADLKEVTKAEHPGRYLAEAETRTVTGAPVRRAATFYCMTPEWEPWGDLLEINVPYLMNPQIDPAVWQEQNVAIGDCLGKLFINAIANRPEGPVLLAGLSEQKPLGRRPTQLDSPQIRDQDVHLRLKLKLLGLEGKWPALQPPRRLTSAPAPALRIGTAAEAGMAPDATERIRAVAQQWVNETGIPFNACVARHGVIFFNEAFGERYGHPVDTQSIFETASTTKAMTGLMLAQFIEQGLIKLDDPIGKFLPDFPTTGPQALTVHHCMTHTTGLDGHSNWSGMANPSLDNVIANGVDILQPGRIVNYDGMGPDLVGKVMEVVSGKSAIRLMHENFYRPLGFHENAVQFDMSEFLYCSAEDLARVGQLLLNKGSYGDQEFFSPAVMDQLMPRPIQEVYPAITDATWTYGIGLMWFHPIGVAGGNLSDIKPGEVFFSRQLFGRGGSSGTWVLVDPEHDIVLTLARNNKGPDYQEHLVTWLRTIEGAMK